MFKQYIPKTLWDYDKAYIYALKAISSKTLSTKKLLEKLSVKTTKEIALQVIQALQQEDWIRDTQVCEDTAIMWIEKKPISRIQLMKKLASYGFNNQDIQNACMRVESTYNNESLLNIGGLSMEFVQTIKAGSQKGNQINRQMPNKTNSPDAMSFWNTMALCSCVQMIRTSIGELTNEKIRNRLKLKGYSVSINLDAIIDYIKKIENNVS